MTSNPTLKSGDIAQEIVAFIRNTRKKYKISNDKLDLYIDLLNRDIEGIDFFVVDWEPIILKSNMGNLNKIEYSLHELFEKGNHFEYINISGYNIYLELPTIEKSKKIDDYKNEISKLEGLKKNYENRLSDTQFKIKAPWEVIEKVKANLIDVENTIQSLKSTILMLKCGKEYYNLLLELGNNERIEWRIQAQREIKSKKELYEKEWFQEVYNPEIKSSEIKELHTQIFTEKL